MGCGQKGQVQLSDQRRLLAAHSFLPLEAGWDLGGAQVKQRDNLSAWPTCETLGEPEIKSCTYATVFWGLHILAESLYPNTPSVVAESMSTSPWVGEARAARFKF